MYNYKYKYRLRYHSAVIGVPNTDTHSFTGFLHCEARLQIHISPKIYKIHVMMLERQSSRSDFHGELFHKIV